MASDRKTCWRTGSATWGFDKARDKVLRASPIFLAASPILLQSPDSIPSIAVRTSFEIRFGGPGTAVAARRGQHERALPAGARRFPGSPRSALAAVRQRTIDQPLASWLCRIANKTTEGPGLKRIILAGSLLLVAASAQAHPNSHTVQGHVTSSGT
jgi:hypothetical protein